MKKMIFGLLLCMPLAAHADAPTPEAVKAFKEIASKADNKHWKEQETRLDSSAKNAQQHTAEWMNSSRKSNPKLTAENIQGRDDEMKKWEDEQFSSDFFKKE